MFNFSHLMLLASSLSAIASAHFFMHYPPSIGFDDDFEGEGPCGSFAIPNATTAAGTSIPVSGFPIFLQSTHPQATWLMRASMTRSADNFTNLDNVIMQTGLGDFCLPDMSLPAEFVGNAGLIQIIQDAVDGYLYQCAAVTFVAGTNTSVSCNNATSLTATLTNQTSFNTTATATTTTTSSTPSQTGAAAILGRNYGGGIAALVVVVLAWMI